MDPKSLAVLEYVEAQLGRLAVQGNAIGEPLLPYLIEQAALEIRKARERRDVLRMAERRFPPPWSAERTTGGRFRITDANAMTLAYV